MLGTRGSEFGIETVGKIKAVSSASRLKRLRARAQRVAGNVGKIGMGPGKYIHALRSIKTALQFKQMRIVDEIAHRGSRDCRARVGNIAHRVAHAIEVSEIECSRDPSNPLGALLCDALVSQHERPLFGEGVFTVDTLRRNRGAQPLEANRMRTRRIEQTSTLSRRALRSVNVERR